MSDTDSTAMSPTITCGILTVSDSCYKKEKEDTSGKELERAFRRAFPSFKVTHKDIIPDDRDKIINTLNKWVEDQCNIVLTTGGTGFSPRDVTPEATRAVIEKEAPGIAYAMITKSLAITPMAMLSRAVAGIKAQSLIVNLPGSAKGAVECFSFIQECIPHALALITDNKTEVTKKHREVQKRVSFVDGCGPSKVITDNVAERPRESTYAMLEVDEAFELVLKESEIRVETERLAVENALFRVLAEDVLAYDDVPPFDASVKDGYAVLASDGEGPRRVRTALGAGDAPHTSPLQPGEAIRIGTGAPIPPGADAVVQVEDTSVLRKSKGEEIEINVNKAPVKGQDIRRMGCDVAKNTVVLMNGERLKAPHVGVLAAVGKSTVTVYKPVSVGIFTTGNELKEHYEELRPGQIRDSNRLALINLLKECHYECDDYGIIRDDPDTIKKAIATALTINDILITTGGVSMGEFDFIKRVLIEDFNATVHFGRVNMKPGKPTTFATLSHEGAKKIVFGLPGNPVSASVTCLLFVIPLLRHLEGANVWQWPTIPYVVSVKKQSTDARPEYVRAVVSYLHGKIVAEPNGGQISSRLNSLVGANGLILMPPSMIPTREYLSHIILIGNLQT
ncbi:gephyrin isoform X3 [Tribolium castaneum]|uniref:gephyrin isoform X3 n=1 Tax=Tribolium castaneum TaxID=7070 RepID=UPI00077DC061|nr:PREDICTED: gephyrin isoform X2 [Tribolium castaneum]|eukprot:XP_015834901.1 PREDICTED: gephyrin isoform X2 [Tribolium castaneum]